MAVLRRVIVRTARGRLRGAGSAAYRGATLALGTYLRRGHDEAALYARGALGAGDLVAGYSDIDVAVVVPGGDRGTRTAGRIRRRWKRLCRVLPSLRRLVDLAVYGEEELAVAAASSTLTARRPVHFGSGKLPDQGRLLVRPGLYRPLRDWRLLRGPDRLPARPEWTLEERWIAGWLELQFLWRGAFALCCNPAAPEAAYTCVKLVADPARIWLWLVHGEKVLGRREALERALRHMPEEAEALHRALDLHRELPSAPEPPLPELLQGCVRLSARLGRRLVEQVGGEDAVGVRLEWAERDELALPARAGEALGGLLGREPVLLPLVDWRARAVPTPPDEAFCPVALDPGDPDAVAAAAAAGAAGAYPSLQADGLMVLPSTRGAILRSVQCAVTDPVSFALAQGRTSAEFPSTPGWSAPDSARRAVAEHAAWLGAGRDAAVRDWAYGQARSTASSVHAMGRLFTAARAALFLESLEAGGPALALTTEAVARRLGERDANARAVVEDAVAAYRACRLDGRRAPPRTVTAFRELVLARPAYAPDASIAGRASKIATAA